ncbi:hypothetical protein J5N97_027497 [Dioscorea zingiberensis]|uniref:Syntaxin N-terminal domain-containing protein n=1 Tax=Dioscorea zingiberensis TaxID=325984 RepID=A0A9D5C5F4_9LILI|nr:hypothetical protein J5N97_027497 [Dioscorea zingiberensis]
MNNLLTDSFKFPHGQYSGEDVELGLQVPNSAELHLDEFFQQVQVIGKHISKLSKLLKKIRDTHEEAKAYDMEGVYGQLMEKGIDGVGKTALLVKTKLEQLDKDNLQNRQKPRCGKGSSVDRSRIATTVALKIKLKERMSDFQALREMIHREHRELVDRRFFTVTGNHADEETIDLLIATGNTEQNFQKAIQERGRGQIMGIIGEINERYDTIKELERKLHELQQVSSAVNYVQSGVSALQNAKKRKKNSRKWMFIAMFLLLFIAVVIVLGMLKPWVHHKHA